MAALCASAFLTTLREATERFELLSQLWSVVVSSGPSLSPYPLQSLALGEMVESYAFELYLEQVSATDNNTRLRVHKTLISPLLQRPLLFENSKSFKHFLTLS